MPNDGCWNFSEENNEVLIVEFHCKGQALGDIPGVCSKDGKIGHASLLALYKGNKETPRYKFRQWKPCNEFSYSAKKEKDVFSSLGQHERKEVIVNSNKSHRLRVAVQ